MGPKLPDSELKVRFDTKMHVHIWGHKNHEAKEEVMLDGRSWKSAKVEKMVHA